MVIDGEYTTLAVRLFLSDDICLSLHHSRVRPWILARLDEDPTKVRQEDSS